MNPEASRGLEEARAAWAEAVTRLTGVAPADDDRAWPLPPVDLVGTINAPDKRDPRVFVESGLRDLVHLLEAASDAGVACPATPAVLDFGCGAGRLLRHVRPWAGRVAAVDRHPRALAWIGTHLPAVDTDLTGGDPPLRCPDASFDLLIANSVFTHIPLGGQPAWAREFARVLRPGGTALVTVLGTEHQDRLLAAADRQALIRQGTFELGPEIDPQTGEVGAFAAVFQTPAACSEAFAATFDVRLRRSVPGHQDVLVLTTRT